MPIRNLHHTLQYLWIALLVGLAGTTQAQPPLRNISIGSLWIVNGVQPDHVTGVEASTQASTSPWLRMYRLSDPDATGLECCWHPIGNADGGIWGKEGNATAELTTSQRLAPSHGASDQPFVGIALADGDAFVRRLGPLTLEVTWKRKPGAIKIRHCMAQEGMRIEVEQAARRQTFYVPLGMDVDVPKSTRCAQEN